MTTTDDFRFDPATGTVIAEPIGSGYGYWAGGHKVSYDPEVGFVLFYRLRTPLEHGRGGHCRVAVSADGFDFTDVWESTKQELAADSIEVGHCLRHDAGEWRLYVSYERAGQPGYWRIDVLTGPGPGDLDTQGRRTVLDPTSFGLGFIKDPFVMRTDGGGYRLYATATPRSGPTSDGRTIVRGPQEETVVAESDDGLHFDRIEYVFEAAMDGSWHGQRARLNGLVPMGDGYLGAFDGSSTAYDNYEERCGFLTSPDGITFHRLPGPWLGRVRYAFPLRVGDRVLWYYEYTRDDGSHDLRVRAVDLPI